GAAIFFRTPSGKGTDRGRVPPTSMIFIGRPRPTWTTMASPTMRAAYGFRRTRARSNFTSGISRSDALDGSRSLPLFATAITPPLAPRCPTGADDADFVFVDFE